MGAYLGDKRIEAFHVGGQKYGEVYVGTNLAYPLSIRMGPSLIRPFWTANMNQQEYEADMSVLTFDQMWDFTRASDAYLWNEATGQYDLFGPDQPRIGSRGILIEQAATNLAWFSEPQSASGSGTPLNDSCTGVGGVTLANQGASHLGIFPGLQITSVATGNTQVARVRGANIETPVNGTEYFIHYYVQVTDAAQQVVVDVQSSSGGTGRGVMSGTVGQTLSQAGSFNGTISVHSQTNLYEDYWLIVLRVSSPDWLGEGMQVSVGPNSLANGAVGRSITWCGLMIEQVSGVPNSYVRTDGAAGTRAADSCLLNMGVFGSSDSLLGTVLVEVDLFNSVLFNQTTLTTNVSGAGADRLIDTLGTGEYRSRYGLTSTAFTGDIPPAEGGRPSLIAVRYSGTNTAIISGNGSGTVDNRTQNTTATQGTWALGQNFFNGFISRVQWWQEELSDDDLKALVGVAA